MFEGSRPDNPRSAPKLRARQRRTLSERFELGPGDHRMNAPAKSAIGRGDHALAPDALGETQNPLRHQLWMFDHIGRMADDARHDDLAIGKLDLFPHRPFMLVAHIASLE